MGRSSKKTKKFISEHKDKLFVYDRLDNLANNCNYIITCVGNDKDLRSVFLSKNGIHNGVRSGTFIIDHTTASPEISKVLFKKFVKKGSYFFDAPVSRIQEKNDSTYATPSYFSYFQVKRTKYSAIDKSHQALILGNFDFWRHHNKAPTCQE